MVARPAAAAVGPSVWFAAGSGFNSSTHVVDFVVESSGKTSGQYLAVYEPNAPAATYSQRVTQTQQSSTSTQRVTPRAASGYWVAVILDGVSASTLPDTWQAAQPYVVAQSAPLTSAAWSVKIVAPRKIETNYAIGGTAPSHHVVYLFDVKSSPVRPTGEHCPQVVVPTGGGEPTCGFGFPPQPPACEMQAVVSFPNATLTYYPEGTVAVSNTFPCPDPGPCFICWVADPVDTLAGRFSESFTDVSVPGRGFGLHLQRGYNSGYAEQQGWFGWGWSSTYESAVASEPIGDGGGGTLTRVTVTRGAGRGLVFVEKPGGGFTSQEGQFLGIEPFQGGWKLSDWKSQMAWIFGSDGRLTDIVDRNAEKTHLDYDTTGAGNAKVTVTDPSLRTLVFVFDKPYADAGKRVLTVTDPAGRTKTYGYEADGDLSTARDINGVLSTFTYEPDYPGAPPHLLTSRVTGEGGSVINDYDGLTSSFIPRVVTQTIKVDRPNTAYPGKELRTTTFAYSGSPLTTSGGYTTVTDDHGAVTKYSYTLGELTSVVSNLGKPDEATTSFEVDGVLHRPTKITDPLGQVTTVSYTSLGEISSITDPRGRVTELAYNSTGQLVCAVNAYQHNQGVTCPTGGGALPLGAAGLGYDSYGNLTSTTDPNGHTTVLDRDPAHPQDVVTVTDPEGRVFTYSYDSYGNLTRSRATPTAGVTLTAQAAYDTLSRVYCTVSPTQDAAGVVCPTTPTPTTWPTGAERIEYQTTSDLVSAYTNAKAGRTTFGYDNDANLTDVSNARGTQSISYDLAHRPTQVTEAVGTTAAMTTKYLYDAQDAYKSGTTPPCAAADEPLAVSCATVTDHAGKVTTSYYTARGQLNRQTTPGNLSQRATYRLDGRPATVTLWGSRTLTADYYADGLLKSITSSVAGTTPVTYDYRADGVRTSMTDGTGSTSYGYDDAGLLTQVTNSNGTVGYSWDTSNRLRTITYPSTRVVTRSYDGAGRFWKVDDGAGHQTIFDLFPDGDIAKINYPNTLSATITRDQLGGMLTNTVKTSTGATKASLTWGRNNFGLVTSEAGTGDTAQTSINYAYDDAWRMKTAAGGSYTFDTGNHLTALAGPTQTFQTNGSGRLATQIDGNKTRAYGYTNGNLTSTTFTSGSGKVINSVYDGANRMTQATVTPAGGTATAYSYGYDGDNLRLTRTTGGVTTKYHYSLADGLPLLISEGNLDYIYGPDGLPIEQIGTDNTNPTYYTHDQHGDTRLLTNQTGTTTAVYTHTPYGVSTRKTGGTANTTLLYGAGHTDTETGYTYLINRYYDPATGQFTTPDPLLPLTGTPYAYGDNNPLNTWDPLGLDTYQDSWNQGVNNAGMASALLTMLAAAGGGGAGFAFAGGGAGGATILGVSAITAGWIIAGVIAGIAVAIAIIAIAQHLCMNEADSAGDATAGESRYPTKEVKTTSDEAATDSQGVLRCRICDTPMTTKSGFPNSREFDHIWPYSRGGGRSIRNIWSLCRTCNRQKGSRALWEWLQHAFFG